MASPDLDAPARVSHLTAAKSPSGSRRLGVPFIVVLSFAFAGSQPCRAQEQTQQSQDQVQAHAPDPNQNVAEAARQERARKQDQQKKAKHVYTAEDLKHVRILTPQDRAELEARKIQQPAAPADGASGRTAAATASPSANSADAPLGEIARRLRREKESQQLQRSAEFPLPFAHAPVLASPKPPTEPLLPFVTVAPVTVAPLTQVVPAPRVVARPFVKRSPFERPRDLPAPPVTPPSLAPAPPALLPVPHTPRVLGTQPPARARPSPRSSGKLTIVTVKPGDSLWKLAASHLGDGRRWQELLKLNPGLGNPERLEVGSQIVVPVSLAPAVTNYTVRHGDTLWTIAQTQLGHGSAWSCIAHANPVLRDENTIEEGQELLLPSSCPQ